jgi:hypothetical protein
MSKKIHITEGQFRGLFGELILNEGIGIKENKQNIVNYIKTFGSKGKLPSFEGQFNSYFKNVLMTAYEWASDKIDEIKRYGFAFFAHEFRVNVISKLTLNKRGLIYVERSIDLDLSQGFDDLNFSSIGECWSWKKSNSNSYCSKISLLNNNKSKVVICGYVHPDSIDWLETVYLNSYDMKNETEIRMNDNALVEVSYIIIDGVKQSIGGSYLINASVDKYNKNKGDW